MLRGVFHDCGNERHRCTDMYRRGVRYDNLYKERLFQNLKFWNSNF
jgi:hypothetical protein